MVGNFEKTISGPKPVIATTILMAPDFNYLSTSLEFDVILEKVASYATSNLGQERVLVIEPNNDEQVIHKKLNLVQEMMGLIKFDDPFPIDGLKDIRKELEQATLAGSSLSIEQLVAVGQTLEVSHKINRYFNSRKEKYSKLYEFFSAIASLPNVIKPIKDSFDWELKEIKDNASPELNRLRKTIRREQEKVRGKLSNIIAKNKDYLRESLITLREGRLVIPLRDDCKGRIKGFIHDRSASGATLFIEPTAIFDMNNQIRELQIDERREVERLLLQMTNMLREQLPAIQDSLAALSELDAFYAISRFGVTWNAVVPKINANELKIFDGYHPILLIKHGKKEKVVPLNLELDSNKKILVITGPNAGGKTVALKTIGLSSMMFQSGIPVFVDGKSEFPVFDHIFVDIGDSQSIEQDLSTFSAHVERLTDIINHSSSRSLVLIDEIGSGTDPAEGSALAMAFLELMKEVGVTIIVTTHQGALKSFAFEMEGVENGSMAFDDKTLTPTYQFQMGIPGSSYAFEIASRFGIPETTIRRARDLVGKEHGKLEKFILDLEHKLNHYHKVLSENELKRTELEGLIKLYKERFSNLKNEEKKFKKEALNESKAILARANSTIEEAVKEIRTKQAEKESIKKARSSITDIKKEIDEQLLKIADSDSKIIELPQKGDEAEWLEMKVKGCVLSEIDAKGLVLFEAGDIKLRLPQKSLKKITRKKDNRKKKLYVPSTEFVESLRTEVDLRGMTMDEAQPVLEKYLDQAYLVGLEQARIIHGKGTGALRKKVTAYLKMHSKINHHHAGAWNEGDVGVTIVHFKK